MSTKDEVINILTCRLSKYIKDEELSTISSEIYHCLYNYDVYVKETTLTTFDDENMRILKYYASSLKLSGRADSTIKQYVDELLIMFRYINKPVKSITTDDIKDYMYTHFILEKHIKERTLENKRRIFSAFFGFLHNHNYLRNNPMSSIPAIKYEKKVKDTFSTYDIETMRNNCRKPIHRAALEFILSTGCRIGEVVNIKISDIDFDTNSCKVKGKGNKERTVLFNEVCKYYLLQYLNTRTHNSEMLFTSRTNEKYSIAGFRLLIKSVGINEDFDVYPNKFRGTMITDSVNRGMSIQNVQKLVGHTSINTTLGYCNLDKNVVYYEYNRCH